MISQYSQECSLLRDANAELLREIDDEGWNAAGHHEEYGVITLGRVDRGFPRDTAKRAVRIEQNSSQRAVRIEQNSSQRAVRIEQNSSQHLDQVRAIADEYVERKGG